MENEKDNKRWHQKWEYVNWGVFIAIITILFGLSYFAITQASNAKDINNSNNLEIKMDIRELQTNYNNISSSLNEIKLLLQKHMEK